MEKAKDVCLAVKAYFAQQNIKLVDVARMLNATPQTITEHLSGERYFGKARADKYAELFGFNPIFLRTGEGALFSAQSAQEEPEGDVSRLIRIIESQQETIAILVRNGDAAKRIGPRFPAKADPIIK